MPGTFKRVWEFFGEEVFVPLAVLEDDAPPSDMFAELGKMLLSQISGVYQRTVDAVQSGLHGMDEANQVIQRKFLARNMGQMHLLESELSGILEYEQQDKALDKLKAANLPSFVEENDVIAFVEKAHSLIMEYKPGWANAYHNFVSRFIWKFGLGYEVRAPFEIRPLITSEFSRLYHVLKKQKGGSGDLLDLLGDFEHSYALFTRQQKVEDLNSALRSAFSYLEGLTGEKLTRRGTVFGELAKQCERDKLFPHKGTLSGSLLKLYGFSSDYPRLRHPGNPQSKIRDLMPEDCISLSLMALLWAGYINGLPTPRMSEQDNQEQVA